MGGRYPRHSGPPPPEAVRRAQAGKQRLNPPLSAGRAAEPIKGQLCGRVRHIEQEAGRQAAARLRGHSRGIVPSVRDGVVATRVQSCGAGLSLACSHPTLE
jgi:hypothetical protein